MAYLDSITRLGPGGGPRRQYVGFVAVVVAVIPSIPPDYIIVPNRASNITTNADGAISVDVGTGGISVGGGDDHIVVNTRYSVG